MPRQLYAYLHRTLSFLILVISLISDMDGEMEVKIQILDLLNRSRTGVIILKGYTNYRCVCV